MTIQPLRAPGKAIVLRATRPNLGVATAYQARLDTLIDAMNKSLLFWISATYRGNEPHALIAQDVSPAVALRKVMRKLARRWTREFNQAGADMARLFADSATTVSDSVLKSTLSKAGLAIPFKATPIMNDAYQAVVGEQVGLIKSIAW